MVEGKRRRRKRDHNILFIGSKLGETGSWGLVFPVSKHSKKKVFDLKINNDKGKEIQS